MLGGIKGLAVRDDRGESNGAVGSALITRGETNVARDSPWVNGLTVRSDLCGTRY